MPKREEKKTPAYLREQGKRGAVGNRQRNLSFSFSKHIKTEGQSIEEWDELGLLKPLLLRIKNLGQHTSLTVRQNNWIKEYHKVAFPPNSGFKEPKHVIGVTWAVSKHTAKCILHE